MAFARFAWGREPGRPRGSLPCSGWPCKPLGYTERPIKVDGVSVAAAINTASEMAGYDSLSGLSRAGPPPGRPVYSGLCWPAPINTPFNMQYGH